MGAVGVGAAILQPVPGKPQALSRARAIAEGLPTSPTLRGVDIGIQHRFHGDPTRRHHLRVKQGPHMKEFLTFQRDSHIEQERE